MTLLNDIFYFGIALNYYEIDPNYYKDKWIMVLEYISRKAIVEHGEIKEIDKNYKYIFTLFVSTDAGAKSWAPILLQNGYIIGIHYSMRNKEKEEN